MARKQLRRSVSVPAEIFWRLKRLTELSKIGDNDSQIVGMLINQAADKLGIPAVTRRQALVELGMDAPPERKPAPEASPEIVSQYFTF